MTTPRQENDVSELRRRLEEAEETLRAIRSGEVDALVVEDAGGERIYTLQGADHPYRALIEAMQQGAVSLSGDGTVLYCNRRFADMVKTPHEKVIGADVSRFLPADERTRFDSLVRQGRLEGSYGEVQLHADNLLLPVYIALAPLPLGGSQALCMIVTDLTEQKQHRDLQEADRRKDEFLAMLAHELRNPLAPIRNALDLLDTSDVSAEVATWAREMMKRQVEHMVRLIDDLLDVARIMRGRIELRRECVDLATVVQRAVETTRPLIDARRHELICELPDAPVWLDVDSVRLSQVLANLLNNATKYTEPGGNIRISAAREGDQAVIRVRDNGTGIEAELLPRVFDLFTQAERSIDRSQGGLGIGLSVVRSLTEMHGGTVRAYSEGTGRGSEFVVMLPVLAEESWSLPASPTPGRTSEAPCHPGGEVSRRILVVDDTPGSAKILAKLLERLLGHEVRIAVDGPSALAAAREFQPDAVILDIGLPGMSGYEVAAQLRSEPQFVRTMMVALTGYGGIEDRRRSREAGFDHHLVKPASAGALREVLAGLRAPE